ncbi:MAG: hypothetical protein ABII79_09775 [bacterium]
MAIAKITQDRGQGGNSDGNLLDTVTTVYSIIMAVMTILLGIITFLSKHWIDRSKETLKEVRDFRDKLEEKSEKLERRSELITQRQKDVIEQMDRYLDSVLITFNKLLPEEKRLAISQLKYVLHLRHYEDGRRFEAIKALGELGDETVIPYLQWAAETDHTWAIDAKIAIADINKRLGKKASSE